MGLGLSICSAQMRSRGAQPCNSSCGVKNQLRINSSTRAASALYLLALVLYDKYRVQQQFPLVPQTCVVGQEAKVAL